jgi:sec-independent protein translocase protein TatC
MSNRGQFLESDDFFADTRMSFGEHIEDLRTHLIRAFLGIGAALLLSFFFGHLVLAFIAAPVEKQLKVFYERRVEEKKAERKTKIESTIDGKPAEVIVPVSREFVERLIGRPIKDPSLLTPDGKYVMFPTVRDLNAELEHFVDIYKEVGPQPTLKSFTIMETVLVWFKVCLISALVLASPWVFYQIWSFIAAGLYPQEKRLVNYYLPFSVGLFLLGVVLCQFVVMPQTISALLFFNEWLGIEPELRLNDWLTFALLLPIVFGLCFQTPLAMFMLDRVGLITVDGFRKKRRIVLFVILVLYVIVSPSPDPWTMLIFFGFMCGLYEMGIIMCRFSPRKPFLDIDVPESEEMVEV